MEVVFNRPMTAHRSAKRRHVERQAGDEKADLTGGRLVTDLTLATDHSQGLQSLPFRILSQPGLARPQQMIAARFLPAMALVGGLTVLMPHTREVCFQALQEAFA